jgi:AraC family transcriptional activator of pobA
MMAQTSIPSYALYGEAQGSLSAGFAHIETIAARSSLHDWEIRPHRHADFVQLLLVHSGQAWITFDGAEQALAGPLAVMVPAGVVHGFRFAADVVGHVVTLGADFTGRAPAPADPLHRALSQGQAAPLAPEAARRAAWLAAEMLAAQADRSAGDPLLLSLAETLARCVAQDAPASGPAPDTRLDRFRQLVEIHYRSHRDLAFYAAALGTTPRTLSRLTAARLGCSPWTWSTAASRAKRTACCATPTPPPPRWRANSASKTRPTSPASTCASPAAARRRIGRKLNRNGGISTCAAFLIMKCLDIKAVRRG